MDLIIKMEKNIQETKTYTQAIKSNLTAEASVKMINKVRIVKTLREIKESALLKELQV